MDSDGDIGHLMDVGTVSHLLAEAYLKGFKDASFSHEEIK